ncbi:MAG: UMP kinase [Candidatus Thorarchaeota archaeon]|nr:UMP kinase [Candidatus Thorarchaeota archaeon]
MRAVLKLGGSLLYRDAEEANLERVRAYANALITLTEDGHQLVVVVGGGIPARAFISAARTLGASETQCDWLGIKIARLNAELLSAALGNVAYPIVAETLDDLERAFISGKIVLMGGLTPGQSTNAVAALAAEVIGADLLLNATNVDGVYDRDPQEQGAKKLDKVTIDKLSTILSSGGVRAGEYRLFDPVAIRVVARSRISTIIFNGTKPENLSRILDGERIGTLIIHDEKTQPV